MKKNFFVLVFAVVLISMLSFSFVGCKKDSTPQDAPVEEGADSGAPAEEAK